MPPCQSWMTLPLTDSLPNERQPGKREEAFGRFLESG